MKPRRLKLYNLTLLRADGDKIFHDMTLAWNEPYTLVHWKMQQIGNNPRTPMAKGQFLYLVPNGVDTLTYYRQKRASKLQKAQRGAKSSK